MRRTLTINFFTYLISVSTVAWSGLTMAYTPSSIYKGSCPDGYYSVVTEPVNASKNYTGKVKEIGLPPNVCVYRNEGTDAVEKYFSKADFIKIEGRSLKPFDGVQYSWGDYEAIIGHYKLGGNYYGSVHAYSPQNPNFTGAHPVLIKKSANASVRYEAKNNLYIINKKIQVPNTKTFVCHSSTSTVGDSASCYSQRNGLILNELNHLELIELADEFSSDLEVEGQDCPQGLGRAVGLGSQRGICTSMEALFSSQNTIAKLELWSPIAVDKKLTCPPNQISKGKYCMPNIAAMHCLMDSASIKLFNKMPYIFASRAVYFWPWHMIHESNGLIDFEENLHRTSTGDIPSSAVEKMMNLFSSDQDFISPADLSKDEHFPVIHLFSHKLCKYFHDNGGWSQEPIPAVW